MTALIIPNSDSSDNEGELAKFKINSEKLLAKYITAIIKEENYCSKADTPKPQLHESDPEDLERFLRQLENMWALEAHKYKIDIIKI